MQCRQVVLWSAMGMAAAGAQARAVDQIDDRLLGDSTATVRTCGFPDFKAELDGGIVFELNTRGPVYDLYDIIKVNWVTNLGHGDEPIWGVGTYQVGGEVALMHRMTLDITLGNGPLQHFDSGLVPFSGAGFPRLAITLTGEGPDCGKDVLFLHTARTCRADFNNDGFVDVFDYIDFIRCFEGENCVRGSDVDINNDGFVDIFDFDAFVERFEKGC